MKRIAILTLTKRLIKLFSPVNKQKCKNITIFSELHHFTAQKGNVHLLTLISGWDVNVNDVLLGYGLTLASSVNMVS